MLAGHSNGTYSTVWQEVSQCDIGTAMWRPKFKSTVSHWTSVVLEQSLSQSNQPQQVVVGKRG